MAALRLALPSKWVIHEYRRDYGIDIQIEVFNADGTATGLRCFGQLKATDREPETDTLSLSRKHFEYWAAQSDPVLLFRYYAAANSFRWCWLHEISWCIKPGADSTAVHSFLRQWSATSGSEIQGFLAQRSLALSSRLLPPFIIALVSRALTPDALVGIAVSTNRLIDDRSFQIVATPTAAAAFTLSVEHEAIACSYVGLPGVVVSRREVTTDVAPLLLFVVLVTACRYDRILTARPLARRAGHLLPPLLPDGLEIPFIDAMVYSLGIATTAETLGLLRDESRVLPIAALFVAAQRYGETEEWIRFLRRALEMPVSKETAATLTYNLGNALAHCMRWPESLAAYNEAVRREPAYQTREYFRCEHAAAYFETGAFDQAIAEYEAALELEPSARTQYLLGDSLYCSGNYERAHTAIVKALELGLEGSDLEHAILFRIACKDMIDTWSTRIQSPQTTQDGGISDLRALEGLRDSQWFDAFRELVQKFGSDGLFNFNAGHAARVAMRPDVAVLRYLNCALRQRWDSEAWALTIATAMELRDAPLMALAGRAGYFFVGEQLVDALLKCCRPAHPDPEALRVWQQQVGDLMRELPRRPARPWTVRFHRDARSADSDQN